VLSRADVQLIVDPGYNRDPAGQSPSGSLRLHLEM